MAEAIAGVARSWCLVAIMLGMLTGCSRQTTPPVGNAVPDSVLKVGDVVFRTGSGLTSHAVLMADPEGDYSHVGIVAQKDGKLVIVHAVPGEPDFEGDPDRVKTDTPEKFFAPLYASAGEVCRFDDSLTAKRASVVALQVFDRNVLFDGDYNIDDTTRMYCTEFVLYCYSRAGHPISNVGIHEYSLPMMPESVVLPVDLYNTGEFKSIYKFNSKKH